MKQNELFEAIRIGDEAQIRALLAENPDLRGSSVGGVTAILYACYTGHAGLAPALLQGEPPAHFGEACALGERSRALELLAADPSRLNAYTEDGFPPLGLAIFFRHPELARELIERGAEVNAHARNQQRVAPLHAAVAVGDRVTAALLVERGADVNARQQGGSRRSTAPRAGVTSR